MVTIALAGLLYGLWRLVNAARTFHRTLRLLTETLRHFTATAAKVTEVAEQVRDELAMLRMATMPATLTPEAQAQVEAAMRAGQMDTRTRAVYPLPDMSRYQVVEPDAKPEDTDKELLQQTDSDLVDEERMEGLRAMGMDVDSRTDHPGVEANA